MTYFTMSIHYPDEFSVVPHGDGVGVYLRGRADGGDEHDLFFAAECAPLIRKLADALERQADRRWHPTEPADSAPVAGGESP